MKTKKIAITGGIGSGKSTVLQYLKEKGFSVFSCDEIYRKICQTPAYVKKIGEAFPEAVQNGAIDRKKLAEIIFEDESKRKILNDISHPLIMQQLLDEMNNTQQPVVFAEVPLLFEGNFEGLFDQIIVVLRDANTRIDAVEKRDNLTKEEIKNRHNSQFNYDSEEGKAHINACGAYLIHNDGSLQCLETELDHFLSQI